MKIECKRLSEINKSEIVELLNHPQVRRHMPLAKDFFDDAAYDAFIADKEQLWAKYGYGPWAFVVEGKFVGWGGLQYEEGDADLALVLHPDYWGIGRAIYETIIKKAFGEMGFESITALLPPSRTRIKGLEKLGFQLDGELIIKSERFLRYRLYSSKHKTGKA
jgi:[ribosomal protein S5]-alanine N-acetyltransferase